MPKHPLDALLPPLKRQEKGNEKEGLPSVGLQQNEYRAPGPMGIPSRV